MIKLYLDTCSIQRPLDTLNQTRLRLEAEAILGILERIRTKEVELISSTVLELETRRNLLAVRREHGEQVLAYASTIVIIDKQIERRAIQFVQTGIKIMDALHVAAAEASNADYFCTCDDRFLRKVKTIAGLSIQSVSPLELIEALEK